MMTIHLIQTDIVWEQPETNFAAMRELFRTAAPAPGDLVLLPEMFATGFSMNAEATAEARSPESPSAAFLHSVAGSSRCVVVGGAAVRSDSGFLNEAIVAYADGQEARYAKHQTFSLSGESKVFKAGSRLLSFGCGSWRVGLTICYDLRFPEIYRALTLGGAELLLNIANWPRQRIDHWVTLLRARAIENQCYVAGVNRVGEDINSHYVGRSLIVDPHGEIIADAGDAAGVTSAQLDLAALRAWRAEFPALADARDSVPPVVHFQPKEDTSA